MKNFTIVLLAALFVMPSSVFADLSSSANTPAPKFNVSVDPGKTVHTGEQLTFHTTLTVFQKGKITQTLLFHDSNNHMDILKSITKLIGQGIGEYATDFSFAFPKGMPPGEYPVILQALMDDKVVAGRIMILELK